MDQRKSGRSRLKLGGAFQEVLACSLRRAANSPFPIFLLSSCLVATTTLHPSFLFVSCFFTMGSMEIEAVQVYKELVDSLLDRAAQVKPDKQIEPPVTEALLDEPVWQVPEGKQEIVQPLYQQTRLAAVEIAFREKFYHILVWIAHLQR